MKAKHKELNVDFIGGQGPLTGDEEKAISQYLRARKNKSEKKRVRRTKVGGKRKAAT